jgi:hypothetical protein
MWAAIVNILIGVWMMVSPAMLNYGKMESDYNYIIGPIAITFAITAVWEVNRSARFLVLLCGVALSISPMLSFFQSSNAIWNNALSGVIMSLISLVKGYIKKHYGGGWRSLFQKQPQHWEGQR